MKDALGAAIKLGDFVQVGRGLAKVLSTRHEQFASVVPLGEEWYNSKSVECQYMIKRDRSDFCPLRYPFMTNEELEARLAVLNQECPNLD